MAEIRIEEKKKGGGSILPWILGLLLLALVIWGIAELIEEGDEEILTEEVVEEEDDYVAPVATDVDNDMEYNGAIQDYMTFIDDMDGRMGLDHEFSHGALTRLATATTALASAKGVTAAQSKSDRVKQMADDITKDPMAGDHADKIKMAALTIVEILEDVDRQTSGGQSANLDALRNEAQAITQETLTLNQKNDVRTFFKQAGDVLQSLS